MLILLGSWQLTRTGGQCGPRIFDLYTIPRIVIILGSLSTGSWLVWSGARHNEQAVRQLIGRLVAVCIGLGLAVLILDIAFRLTDPPRTTLEKANHPLSGAWFVPNRRAWNRSLDGEFLITWRTDRRGIIIRDGPNRPQPDAFRILALGDSFTQGGHTLMEDSTTVLLTDDLETRLGIPVQTINLGFSASGPTTYLMIYRSFVEAFDPDMVVMMLYIGNDFTEDARLYHADRLNYDSEGRVVSIKEYFDYDAGLAWTPFLPDPIFIESMTDDIVDRDAWHGGFFSAAHELFVYGVCKPLSPEEIYAIILPRDQVEQRPFISGEGLDCKSLDGSLTGFCFNYAIRNESLVRNNGAAIYKDTYLPEDMEDIQRTLDSIEQLIEETTAADQKFVMVIIPHAGEVPQQMQGSASQAGIPAGTIIDSEQPYKLLDQFCEENQITCVNLLPVFREHTDSVLYYHYDIHWTTLGNQLAADTIAGAVLEAAR